MLKQTLIAVGAVVAVFFVLLLLLGPATTFKFSMGLFAVFLILLVLVQRGRGGGLAGAFGGAGGSSAFGAKAGDAFTQVTIVAASLWIVLCVSAAVWSKYSLGDSLGKDKAQIGAGRDDGPRGDGAGGAEPDADDGPVKEGPADEGPDGEDS